MIHRQRPITRLLPAAAILAIVGAGATARAQDDEEGEAQAPAAVRARNVAMANNQIRLDQFLFSNIGMGNAAMARDKVESLLTLQVEELSRGCGLTPAQKKKLQLAGRGDIKRFFDRVEEVRRKYLSNPNFTFNAQVQQVWQDVQPLQAAYQAGLFGNGSIYAKTIHATLSPDQARKSEESSRDRVLYLYWARVDLGLELLNNQVGFTDEQRGRLLELLREETRPPRKMGGRSDHFVVLYQLSRIPEAKLRPIFEDYQWPLIDRQLQHGRLYENMLKQQGFEPDDSPAAAKANTRREGVKQK